MILGYNVDFDVSIIILIIDISSIFFIIIIVLISYQKNKPNLIRYIGKSTLMVFYTTFFTILFFCQEIISTLAISIFMAFLIIMISKLIEMRNYERYVYKKYIKNDKYPPISLQIKIVRFQRAYYNLRLFLYIFPFLNLTFNLIILWRHSYYNEALLISVIPIIIIMVGYENFYF